LSTLVSYGAVEAAESTRANFRKPATLSVEIARPLRGSIARGAELVAAAHVTNLKEALLEAIAGAA
jgi:hypothetical protein